MDQKLPHFPLLVEVKSKVDGPYASAWISVLFQHFWAISVFFDRPIWFNTPITIFSNHVLLGPSTFARRLTINIHPFEPDLEIVLTFKLSFVTHDYLSFEVIISIQFVEN